MRIRARKFVIAAAVAALALANSVSARHALAAVPHHGAAAAHAHDRGGGDHAHHSHGHDAAQANGEMAHDTVAPSGALADQNCCAAWCAGAALIFATPLLHHAAPVRDFQTAPTHAIVLSALNSLDPPPR